MFLGLFLLDSLVSQADVFVISCTNLYLFRFMKTALFIYPLTDGSFNFTGSYGSEKKVPKQYNIVYIMTDDHTAQMMSCYGSHVVETPNLDRIANDGVIFTNSFVANSLSGPSRACMLTGKHSHANGFTDNTTCVFDGSPTDHAETPAKSRLPDCIIGSGIL